MSRPRQPAGLDIDLCFDFAKVLPLRGYTYFEAKTQWLGRGDWRVTVPREIRAGRVLTEVALTPPEQLDKARWQVVARPVGEERVIASLLVRDIDVDFGWVEGAARDTLTCYGDTYTAMFQTVVVSPDPAVAASTTGLSTWTSRVDSRTGPAEDVALALIADHFGPAAPVAAARFSRLNIPASLHRGATVTSSGRLPTLLDELRAVCEEGGITVRLEQGAPGVVDVVVTVQQLREDVDLSRDRNTILGWRARGSRAGVGSLLVGGKGEDEARLFTQYDVPAPAGGWAFPRRAFVNATGDDTLAGMRQVARNDLPDLNPPVAISIRSSPATRWVAGVDYDLGDRLPVSEGDAEDLEVRVDEVVTRHAEQAAPVQEAGTGLGAGRELVSKLNRLSRALRRTTTR